MARARFAAGIGALAALLWAVAGHGLVNYDTLHTLAWGRDLAHGELPDYDVPLAPTPHPLATLAALLATPITQLESGGVDGELAANLTLALAFVALALLGWVTYRLGATWFHPAVGILAAVLLLTRRPVLDFGARAYVDLPYLVLVLGAALVESRRPKAGRDVLLLLGAAGLIRPEAWLFAAAYLVWTRDLRLLPYAAIGPVGWALYDLLITGNPLHSLTDTQDNAEALERVTGLSNVPGTVPRRLGEILREPVLLGAAGGGVLALLWLRERVKVAVATGVLAMLAFCVLAGAGLPILGRYLLLPATILTLFAAAGVLGWLALPPDDPRRRPWQAFGALVAVALLAFAPAQVDRLSDLRRALERQSAIQGDLRALVRDDRVPCAITVPNRRPIPLLALWLDRPPQAIATAQEAAPATGAYLAPATSKVASDYILDPRDRDRTVAPPPPGFRETDRNASWRLLTRSCG
ncbi:MAG: hypothetical protein JWO90_161 [Solirubrobacterales bacterium]|jgi:hypothetical protein|nr:hypothetical protein [Solirubrobacterales bacterium]